MEKITYDSKTMRFTRGDRVPNDVIECPVCHTYTMKLVNIQNKARYYRCSECQILVTRED